MLTSNVQEALDPIYDKLQYEVQQILAPYVLTEATRKIVSSMVILAVVQRMTDGLTALSRQRIERLEA